MTTPVQWEIVLIDDEEGIRKVMTITLADAGYHVRSAGNGPDGIQLCRAVPPQIVITDIRMPGMDGLEVLAALKKSNPEIEVIVITAFGDINTAIKALQLDASDFITKPVNDKALELALQRAKERFLSRRQLKDYTTLLENENARTAQELIKTVNFRNNLIENSLDGIMGCDDGGTVIIFNKSLEKMLGFPSQDVLQQMTFDQFLEPEAEKIFRQKLTDPGPIGENCLFRHETALRSQSGGQIPVQLSAIVLFENGHENGMVCFIRDLREMHRLEGKIKDQARILHQDKMMSLGRLSASMVHEINNPLAGILTYTRLMGRILDDGPLPAEQIKRFQRHLKLMESETMRCSDIVSNLLTFSRRSPPSKQPVNVEELLNRCILLSRHKLMLSHIKLTTDIGSPIPLLEADFNQLQQCIINLIFNAIDAMPDGGDLLLAGVHDPDDHLVRITVKDSGTGISPENMSRIFEPFFTTKKEGYGVGLGLSILYGIVESNNGRVAVNSQPGQGAAFVLEFDV
jgi:PAS domain S-box-containing protein